MGHKALDGKGKEVEEMQGMGSEEASLVEQCYITKNSTTEHRTLTRLERELHTAFHFEHGSG